MSNPVEKDRVVVVIVNWERPQETIQCVQSIMESDFPNIQIIVIDNGSSDDSLEQIQREFPAITLIPLPDNLGFTGGYNTGIEYALKTDTSHVFLINNDTVIENDTIQRLVDSQWDVAVPKITYYENSNLIWAAGARWRRFPPTVKMIGYQKQDNKKYNRSYPLDYATGCALMVKTAVLSKLGGFDPQYVNYMEDYDFSYRVRESGYSMGYVPEAKVLHKVSRSLGISSPQRWHYLGRNTVLFYRKGDRFPTYMLWSSLAWIIIREILLGNSSQISSFYQGVKEGLKFLSEQNRY